MRTFFAGCGAQLPVVRKAEVVEAQSTVEFSFQPGPMFATEPLLAELPTMRQPTLATAELERPLSVMSLPDPPHGCTANIPSRPDTTDIGDLLHTAEEDFHRRVPSEYGDAFSRQTTNLVETVAAPLGAQPAVPSNVTDTGEPLDALQMAAELSFKTLVTDHPFGPPENEKRPYSPGSLEDPQSEAGDPSPPGMTSHRVPAELRPEAEETSAAATLQRESCQHSQASPMLPQTPVNKVAAADAAAAAELERATARKSHRASITSWNVPSRRGMCRTVAERVALVMKGPQRISHAGPPLAHGVPTPAAVGRQYHQGKLRMDRNEPLRVPSVSAGIAQRPAFPDSLGGVLSVASKPSSTRRS
jgi:hypothetical protein